MVSTVLQNIIILGSLLYCSALWSGIHYSCCILAYVYNLTTSFSSDQSEWVSEWSFTSRSILFTVSAMRLIVNCHPYKSAPAFWHCRHYLQQSAVSIISQGERVGKNGHSQKQSYCTVGSFIMLWKWARIAKESTSY